MNAKQYIDGVEYGLGRSFTDKEQRKLARLYNNGISVVDAIAAFKCVMTPAQMNAVLAVHSARAEPIIPDGWQVPNGYTLRGPRGNKKSISVDANGNVDEFGVRLWLDGIAYGDAKAASR